MNLTVSAHALLPGVSNEAGNARLFDKINMNLLSVGQLCDDGSTVTFTRRRATITKNNSILMTAQRDPNNGMWVYEFDKNNISKKKLWS